MSVDTLPHFDFKRQADGQYVFTTNGGSVYSLSFPAFTFFGGIPIYSFNIDRIKMGNPSLEDSILLRNTVAIVMASFFRDIDNAIVSTCDTDDGRQNCRKRLFDRWFRQLNDGSILIRESEIDTGVGMTWATMYYHRENMFRTLLERSFDELAGL